MTSKLIPGIGNVEESQASQALVPGIGNFDDPGTGASYLSLVGPSSTIVGELSAEFTVTLNSVSDQVVNITLSDDGDPGTFQPTSISLNPGANAATFRYFATTSGTKTISISNDADLENPIPLLLEAEAKAVVLTVSITGDGGQRIIVSGTYDEVVTSGEVVLNGDINYGPIPLVITPSESSFTGDLMPVPPGEYLNATITLRNDAGDTVYTGGNPFTIIGISGNLQVTAPATAFVIDGPSSGDVGDSLLFTSSVNGESSALITVTDNGGGGSFIPSNVFPADGGTMTYIPGTSGIKFLTFSNNAGLPNPPNFAVTVADTGTGPEPVITVSVLPETATVNGGGTQQFTGVVSNSTNQNGTWTVNGGGQVSTTGLFTAPAPTVIAQTISVIFTSEADPTKSDSATITVPAATNTGGGEDPDPGPIVGATPVRQYSSNITNKYGVAIEGAAVTVTNEDTGEKAELFEDYELTKKIYNPIITNEEGLFQFFVKAVQCSYSVRGKGIDPYSRENIFDIINNVDITPLTQAIQNLSVEKVSQTQLAQVMVNVPTVNEVQVVETGLSELSETVTQHSSTLTTLESDVEEIKANGAASIVDVHKSVTGGAGTLADPWTGWTSIVWAANTQYDFRDGVYAYAASPNFAKDFLKLNGRRNTVLKHTGNGAAMTLDAGVNASDVVVGMDIRVKLEGNANSTAILMRGLAQSQIDIDANNVPGTVFNEISCLNNTYRLTTSPTKRTRTVTPVTLLQTSKRAAGVGNGGSTYYLTAEGCSGTGVVLADIVSATFSGISQNNVRGLEVAASVKNCTFATFMTNGNQQYGSSVLGEYCIFNNFRCEDATLGGKGNVVIGGVFDTLKLRGDGHTIGPTTVSVNNGVFDNGAINTALRSVLNATTGKYVADVTREIQELNVLGKSFMSGDTLSIGDAQIYKNPAGQVCFGTSQPTGVARFTLYNPNNTANDINLQSILQSFSTTAYHYKANSGGGTDVFLIAGNGNTTNLNNSYAAISDERLKENITDASPKLLDLMNVRIVNYNLIEGDGEKLLGVLAGELEAIFPGMISVDENGVKSVKYSVFVPMIIKALQEMRAEYLNQ